MPLATATAVLTAGACGASHALPSATDDSAAAAAPAQIRVDQLGYLTEEHKHARLMTADELATATSPWSTRALDMTGAAIIAGAVQLAVRNR